jgi:hypothetical protein
MPFQTPSTDAFAPGQSTQPLVYPTQFSRYRVTSTNGSAAARSWLLRESRKSR